jgi:hypothetical protein
MLEAGKKSLLKLRLCSCSSRFAVCASMCALISHDLISLTTSGGGYECSLLSFVCAVNVDRSVSLVTISTVHLL